MDILAFELKYIKHSIIDGIIFENAVFVKIIINSIKVNITKDTLAIASELIQSSKGSGKYLIFTSISGIADELGWDYVNVTQKHNTINWYFEYENQIYNYNFSKIQYIDVIYNLEQKINNIPNKFHLEPSEVVFPE